MVERMVAQEDEFNGIMDFMTEGDDDLGPPGRAAQQDLCPTTTTKTSQTQPDSTTSYDGLETAEWHRHRHQM